MELGLGTIIYLIYVGLLLLGIVPAGLIWYAKYWNGTKFIKAQLAKTPIDTFGGVFNKWKEFTFQEDDERFLPKLQGKFFDTILSPKGFIFLNIGISLILLIIPIFFPAETWFLGILWLLPSFIAYRKTYNRFREIEGAREAQIRRMYDVANAALKFDPMTAYMPASVVNVTKWKNRTIPQSVVIIYPTNFRADQPQAQENFERLFNTAITDENAWIYTWHPTKNAIQCRPVEDLPKMVEYKGAGPFGWHTFPLGVGLGPKGQEIISYSVNRNEKTNMYFPHVLVAGTTGSGKSVIQRNIIFHCIQHNDRWSFLGVDLKRVELSPFRKYTKTVLAIATTLEEGVEVVKYAHDVMMERYTRMEGAGVNHFLDMVDENGTPEKAILLMVDEAYMFMSPEGNKTEEGKMRDMLHAEASQVLGDIARLGRAAGVHLVLATQRPDATVIKGELKNNLDVRIAAGRLDSTPSLMVLDSGAATMLPTDFKGRGVARIGGDLKQFQGFFADQDWIDNWLAKPQNRWREPGLFRSATDTKDKGFDSIPDIEETFTPNSTAEDINIVEDSDIDLEALAAELGLEVDDLLELASEDLQDSNDIDEEEIDLSEFIDSLEDDDLESPDEESNNNVEDNLEEFDFEKDIDDEELEKMAREFMFDDELPDDFEEAITEEEIEQLLAELSDDIIPSLVEVESDNNISKQDDASPIIIDSEGEDEFDMFKRPQREAPLKVEDPNSINDTNGEKVADSKAKEEAQLDTNKISTLGNGLKIAIDEEDEPLNLDNSKVEELKTSSKDGRMLIPKKPTR
jgi:hypothetical protein